MNYGKESLYAMKKLQISSALKISLIYALIGGLWILLSDQVVAILFTKPAFDYPNIQRLVLCHRHGIHPFHSNKKRKKHVEYSRAKFFGSF